MTLAELTQKICTKCQVSKPVDCFSKATRYKNGLQSGCKECYKQYYEANPEKVKADAKKWQLANPKKVKSANRKWQLANPEKVKAANKKYRVDNPEKMSVKNKKYRVDNPEYAKQYRVKNKEKIATGGKQYRTDNPEKRRNIANIRRARKLNNGVFKITPKELKRLYESPCLYCGSSESIQADHVIPIARGGQHSIGNLVPACAKCNQSKGSKFLVEWRITT